MATRLELLQILACLPPMPVRQDPGPYRRLTALSRPWVELTDPQAIADHRAWMEEDERREAARRRKRGH